MKTFNTTDTCRPNEHYMVDITDRLEIIRKMIAKGDHFCMNRGRQYGKTYALNAETISVVPKHMSYVNGGGVNPLNSKQLRQKSQPAMSTLRECL